jgi:hypothetical protein
MSSILNSISSGDLRVQEAPGVTPKHSSIVDILQNSEIEFNTCPTFKNNISNFNTGFGNRNELHYKTHCTKPKLNTPLYKENYLREFVTKEEKAAARHALGLYNTDDVVAMSLLTTEDSIPTIKDILQAPIKQLKQGNSLFLPITSSAAVFDSSGNSLDVKFRDIQNSLTQQNNAFTAILKPSNSSSITSLGDVSAFLSGFKNGDTLKDTIEAVNKELLKFEVTGQIN